jgi:hypothetical protein
MLEKKITFGELKAKLDTFTPEQLAQRVMWGGEDRGGYVGEVHVFEDDQVNPSGDGWESAADYRKQLLEDGETPEEADQIVEAEIVLRKGSPVLFVDLRADSLRAGDVVLHRPTGEKWVLAYAVMERNEVAACGWPPSCAKADDCVLVEAAMDETHEKMLREWAEKVPMEADYHGDHRSSECKRQLAALEARRKGMASPRPVAPPGPAGDF